jgi:rhamnogalacturonyl hydrolase YesR
LVVVTIAAWLGGGCATQKSVGSRHFSDWPAGAAPAEVGRRVADNVLARKFDFETNPRRKVLIYPEACAWYGALTLAELSGQTNLLARGVERLDRFLTPEGAIHLSTNAHVDYRVIGIVPLQIFLETRDPRHLEAGLALADAQWANPTPDGLTAEARYWIDDMYMIPALQVQAFRATGDGKYLDRAALAMVAYLDRLQQPNGLFFHGPDSPFFWGRGNGWMAAGMAELLRELPAQHPRRERILAGYRKMMSALLEYQDGQGLWHQLVDKPASWPETSGTGMFTFAFVTGVKEGWLADGTYGPAARKAWIALVGYLDAEANLREVCVGTNKGKSEQYYLDRPRAVGDLHGQAPLLWSASALLR